VSNSQDPTQQSAEEQRALEQISRHENVLNILNLVGAIFALLGIVTSLFTIKETAIDFKTFKTGALIALGALLAIAFMYGIIRLLRRRDDRLKTVRANLHTAYAQALIGSPLRPSHSSRWKLHA
jgi:membrane associated rhomboid family serine protease